MSQGDIIKVYTLPMGENKEDGVRSLVKVVKAVGIYWNKNHVIFSFFFPFYSEVVQTLEQVAQRWCVPSILGNTQT